MRVSTPAIERRIITLVIAMLLASPLPGGSVTVQFDKSRDACMEVSLPRWTPATIPAGSYPPDWTHLLISSANSGLAFRALQGGILVGVYVAPEGKPPIYSPTKYAVRFPDGVARKATKAEWESASDYVSVREWKFVPGISTGPRFRVIYKSKEFGKSGAKWPAIIEQTVRLSGDGKYLAVHSWDGEDFPGGDLAEILFGPRARIKGNFYIDLYDTLSDAKTAFRGHFHDVSPGQLFDRSAWVSDRYYVLPLDHNSLKDILNQFVLCDMNRAAPGS